MLRALVPATSIALALVLAFGAPAKASTDAAAGTAPPAQTGKHEAAAAAPDPAPVGAPVPGTAPADPSPASAAATPTTTPAATGAARRRDRLARFGREGPPQARRYMIGVAGVLMQSAPLRVRAVYLDPRDVGRSVALGGLGLFARFRPRPIVGLDLDIRSGSVRYRRGDADVSVSQDQVLAELGALLYLGRGDIAQFALSGGVGGMYTLVRYDAFKQTGRQAFGSAMVRVGAEAEFLLKRIAIVLSFRTYGVMTPRDRVHNSGAVLDAASDEARRAPVAGFATMLLGSAGIAYRF
jgi:hypothetical protein